MRLHFYKGVALFAALAIESQAIRPYDSSSREIDEQMMLGQVWSEADSQFNFMGHAKNAIHQFMSPKQ